MGGSSFWLPSRPQRPSAGPAAAAAPPLFTSTHHHPHTHTAPLTHILLSYPLTTSPSTSNLQWLLTHGSGIDCGRVLWRPTAWEGTAAARGLNISRAPCDGQLQKLVSNPFSGSGRSQPQPAISRPWKTAVGTSLCQISCQPRTQLHVQISWQAQQIVR